MEEKAALIEWGLKRESLYHSTAPFSRESRIKVFFPVLHPIVCPNFNESLLPGSGQIPYPVNASLIPHPERRASLYKEWSSFKYEHCVLYLNQTKLCNRLTWNCLLSFKSCLLSKSCFRRNILLHNTMSVKLTWKTTSHHYLERKYANGKS